MNIKTDNIVEKIKQARKELGWSMETTARYLEVSNSTYTRWEYGKTEPNHENTLKIQVFLEEYESGKLKSG